MNFGRFALFTGAGAGIWVIILTGVGYWFGVTTEGLSYAELVHQAKTALDEHLIWIIGGCGLLVGAYAWIHRLAAGPKSIPR